MYDMSGNLLASSRNEIFDDNLTGKKMNRAALHILATEKQSKFIHTEPIDHKGNDKLGDLVRVYNRMIEELAPDGRKCPESSNYNRRGNT
jgi:hypothetical protein